jgi:glucose-1-phosphate thymidylyltransferase
VLEASVEGEVDTGSTIEGTAVVAAGAKVTGSRLVGPVVIGASCIVEDAVVGPDVSLEPGCELIRSTVRDSILMEGCRVVDVDGLAGSILGRNVEVRHSGADGLHRLVVGDQSRVEVD